MISCLPINEDKTLYVPYNVIFDNLCEECGLPKDLLYWNVSDGKVWNTIPSYHDEEEMNVYTEDPEKVEVADAIKTVMKYIKKYKSK